MKSLWTPHRAALAISLGWLAFVAFTLSSFGLTSDSPSLFYAGDRHLFWLLHPTLHDALNFLAPDPAAFHSNFTRFPANDDPIHYPVFPGFVAAIVSALTASTLGALGAHLPVVDGHQLGLALLQAANLYLFARYAISLFGFTAGFSGTLMLAFFPGVVGHAVNNAKDLPSALLYGTALMAGARGVLRRAPRDLLYCGLLTGVALSCKPNAVFALCTLLLWLPLAYVVRLRRTPAEPEPARQTWWRLVGPAWWRPLAVVLLAGVANPIGLAIAAALLLLEPLGTDALAGNANLSRRWYVAFAAIPLVAIVTFIVLWPWLWAGGGLTFAGRLSAYLGWMGGFGVSPRATFTNYPLRCLIFTTPPLVLLLAALGISRAGAAAPEQGERGPLLWLLILWLALPLARIALPHSMFYDANRHFLEYIPALCLLAGLGFAAAWQALRAFPFRQHLARLSAIAALCASTALALAVPIAVTHPYEVAYFNWFTGGLEGAQRRALYRVAGADWRAPGTEGDYWHSSLRDFMRHVGSLVPAKALIGVCGTGYMQAAPEWNGNLRFTSEDDAGDFIYAGPREGFCSWARIRTLESQRPVLLRVLRDGGLIYEILGPKAGHPLAVVTPPTAYDPVGTLLGSGFLLPKGTNLTDDSALEDGHAIAFSDNSKAGAAAIVPIPSRHLTLKARGDACDGPPLAVISVDGAEVGTVTVEASSWTDYTLTTPTVAGQHLVQVQFPNDKYVPPSCDRNLYVASLKFE